MKLAFVIPGDLLQRTGGYGYDREVLARLPDFEIDAYHLSLPATFPFPSSDDVAHTAAILAAIPTDHALLLDGLAYGALPASVLAALPHDLYALVHHPLGHEAGLSAQQSADLLAQEQENLHMGQHIFVSSAYTAAILQRDFALPPTRITCAEPGTAKAPRTFLRPHAAPVQILAVGSLIPRKAYHLLIEALAPLQHLPWQLTIIGAGRDTDYAQNLQTHIARLGLEGRIACVGEYDETALNAAYQTADLFVSASLYEGYGMSLAEALMRGLPLIASTGGAAAFTVPEGAGIKIPPNNVPALTHALTHMIADERARHLYAEASWQAGQKLPTWDDTARLIARALHQHGRAL